MADPQRPWLISKPPGYQADADRPWRAGEKPPRRLGLQAATLEPVSLEAPPMAVSSTNVADSRRIISPNAKYQATIDERPLGWQESAREVLGSMTAGFYGMDVPEEYSERPAAHIGKLLGEFGPVGAAVTGARMLLRPLGKKVAEAGTKLALRGAADVTKRDLAKQAMKEIGLRAAEGAVAGAGFGAAKQGVRELTKEPLSLSDLVTGQEPQGFDPAEVGIEAAFWGGMEAVMGSFGAFGRLIKTAIRGKKYRAAEELYRQATAEAPQLRIPQVEEFLHRKDQLRIGYDPPPGTGDNFTFRDPNIAELRGDNPAQRRLPAPPERRTLTYRPQPGQGYGPEGEFTYRDPNAADAAMANEARLGDLAESQATYEAPRRRLALESRLADLAESVDNAGVEQPVAGQVQRVTPTPTSEVIPSVKEGTDVRGRTDIVRRAEESQSQNVGSGNPSEGETYQGTRTPSEQRVGGDTGNAGNRAEFGQNDVSTVGSSPKVAPPVTKGGGKVWYSGSTGQSAPGKYLYVTDNPTYAKKFGENVEQVSISPKNTLDLSGLGERSISRERAIAELKKRGVDAAIPLDDEVYKPIWQWIRKYPEVADRAKGSGFDAIQLKETFGGSGKRENSIMLLDESAYTKSPAPTAKTPVGKEPAAAVNTDALPMGWRRSTSEWIDKRGKSYKREPQDLTQIKSTRESYKFREKPSEEAKKGLRDQKFRPTDKSQLTWVGPKVKVESGQTPSKMVATDTRGATPDITAIKQGDGIFFTMPGFKKLHNGKVQDIITKDGVTEYYQIKSRGQLYSVPVNDVFLSRRTEGIRRYNAAFADLQPAERAAAKADSKAFDDLLMANIDRILPEDRIKEVYGEGFAADKGGKVRSQAMANQALLNEAREKVAAELKIADVSNPVERANALAKLQEMMGKSESGMVGEHTVNKVAVELDLKVGDEVRIEGDWHRVVAKGDGEVTLADGRVFTIDDTFDELPVDVKASGEPLVERGVSPENTNLQKVADESFDNPFGVTVKRQATPEELAAAEAQAKSGAAPKVEPEPVPEPAIKTEATAAGDQITFAGQREIPRDKLRKVGKKAKNVQSQGDLMAPDKIAVGNLPQDQIGLVPKKGKGTRAYSFAGAAAGFQQDDNGNITFDPKLAVLGIGLSAAGAVGMTRGQQIREARRLAREGHMTGAAAKEMETAISKGERITVFESGTSKESVAIGTQPPKPVHPNPAPVTQEGRIAGINANNFRIEDEARTILKETIEKIRPEVEAIKGPIRTMEELEVAANMSKVLKNTVTREESLRVDAMVKATQQEIARLSAKAERGAGLEEAEWTKYMEMMQALSTEASSRGRALQALSGGIDPAESVMSQVIRRILKVNDDATAIIADAKGVDWRNGEEITKFFRKHVPATFLEKLSEYRYINLLSSPRTHIINAFSNFLQSAALRPATIMSTGAVDMIAAGLTGRDRERYIREVLPFYKGMYNSVGKAGAGALDALSGRKLMERPDLDHIATGSKWLEKTKLVYIPRALDAMDVFFRTLVKGGEVEALAARAKISGQPLTKMKIREIREQADEQALYSVFRKPLDAANASGQGTLLSMIDKGANAVKMFPGAKWYVPFIQTPTNILKQGIEYSPMGLFTLAKNKDKVQQLGKMVVGSTVFAGAMSFAMSGNTTWAAPRGKREREMFYAAGMQPYSIRIGDTWYSYSKLGPLSYPIAMAAAFRYHSTDSTSSLSDDKLKVAAEVLGGISEFFSDQSYVQGMGELLGVLTGVAGSGARAVTNIPRQFIPLSALQNWIAGLVDPIFRKADKDLSAGAIVDNLKKGIPGLSKQLNPYTNLVGEPSERPSVFGNALSPVQFRPDSEKSSVYREIRQRQQEADLASKQKQNMYDSLGSDMAKDPIEAQRILENAVASGMIDKRRAKELLGSMQYSPEVQKFYRLDLQTAIDAYRLGKPETKAVLAPHLMSMIKKWNKGATPATRQRLMPEVEKILPELEQVSR